MPGLQEYHKALQDEGSPLAAGSTAAEFEQQWKDNVGGLYQSVKKTHPNFGVDQATFEGKFQEAPAVDTATDAVNEPASDGLSPAVDPLSQGLGPLSPQGVGEAQLEQINQAGETEADPFAIPEAATQEGKSTTAERAANVRTGVLGQKYEVGTTDVFGRPIQEKEKEETSGFTPISGDESPLVMGSKALNTAEVLKKEYPEGSEEGRYEEGTKALSHGMTAMSKNIEAMARIFDASYGEGKYAELSSKHAILAQDAASDPQDKEKQVALEIFEKENERMLSNVAYVEAAKAQTVQQRGGQEMQQIIRDTPTYQKERAYLKTLQKEKDKKGLHLSSGVWLDPTDTVDQWAVGALARAAKNVGAVIGSQSLQESARAWEREYSPPSNLTRNGIEYLVTLPSGKKASIDPETKEIQYVLNSDGTKDDEYEVTAEDTDKAKSSDPSKTFNMQSLSWQTASVIGDLAIDVAVTMGTGGVAGAALRSARTGMAVGQFISPALRVQYQAQDDAVRSGASANEAYVDQLTMGIGYGLASRINPLESQLAGRIMGHGSNSAMRKINQYAAGQITASDLAKHVTGGILKSGGKEILEEHFEQEVMENVINAANNQYLGGTRDVGFSTQDELLTTTIVAGAVGLLGGTGNVNWSKSELATSAIKKMLADPKQARAMLEGIRAKDPQEASRKERILEAVLTDYENADVPESKQAELAGLLVTSYNLSDEITQHDPDSPVAASNQEKLNRINEKIKRIVNPELFAPEPDKPDPAALPDDNDTPDNVTEAPTFDVNEDAAAASDAELAAQVILDGEEDTPARQEAVARGIDLTDLEAVAAGETRKAGQELGSVAAAVAAGAELSPQQQQTYDSNKEIIDGLTAAPPKIGDTVTIGTGKAAKKFTFDADGWTFSPSKDTQIKVPRSGLRSVEAAFYAQSRVAPSVTPPVAPSVGASFTSKDGQTFTVTGPLDAQGNIPVDGPAGRSIPVNPNSQLGKALIAAQPPTTSQSTKYIRSDVRRTTDVKAFASAMTQAIEARGDDRLQVDVLTEEGAQKILDEGGKLFLTKDGMAGAYVKADGYMGGLFKNPKATKSKAAKALQDARRASGGSFFDAYGTHLEKIYIENGFEPVARLPFNEEFAPEGWQETNLASKPDVVFFVYNPKGARKEGAGKKFTDYDEAYQYAADLAAKVNNKKNKPRTKKAETTVVEEVKIQPKAEEKLPYNNRPPLSTLINSRGAPSKQGLAAQAEKALKSLKAMGANVRFVIYDSVEDIPANRRRYAPGSRGFMVKAGESYTIYISSQLANPFTVFHEAAHVAFDLFVGQNDVDKANKIHTVLRSVLINGTKEEKALSARIDKLTEQYNRDVQGEEYFAELVGVLAASRQQISKPALKKVFEAINKFLSEVFNTRVQLFPEDATVSDLIDFVNTLAGNLSTGEMTVLTEASKLGLSIDKSKGTSVRKSVTLNRQTDLDGYRQDINRIDDQIVDAILAGEDLTELIDARNEVVLNIADYKILNGLPVRDSGREALVLDRVREAAGSRGAEVAEVFRDIMADSRATQEEYMANNADATQAFFSNVVSGESDVFKPTRTWSPVIPLTEENRNTLDIYKQYTGKFDEHIATSIPTFRETQIKTANAITEMQTTNGRAVNQDLEDIKTDYAKQSGIQNKPVYTAVDKQLFDKIADYHTNATDVRKDPVMVASYEALLTETRAQYEMLVEAGYEIRPWLKEGEPYGVDSNAVRKDIQENKRLFYLRSRSATGEANEDETAENYIPFRETGIVIDGDPVLYNDLFRAVHDIFGHGMVANTFSTQGEFDAYATHAAMYSQEAQKALFMETVVYNAYYDKFKNYAPRKIYDIPEEFIDGTSMKVYDIGGSEGTWNKTISTQTGGRIRTINLDPNPDMVQAFKQNPVEGSTVVPEAFYEGFDSFSKHEPDSPADIVHESMTFQFISKQRAGFIKEIKSKYLKPGGLLLLEEKIIPELQEDWETNEAKKEEYKRKFYDDKQLTTKQEEVLVGMKNNQAKYSTLIKDLESQFSVVEEYWDAGNFRGILATNDQNKANSFMQELGGPITSEFSQAPTDPVRRIPNQLLTTDPVISRMNQMEAYRNQAVAAMDSRADFTDGDIEAIERSMEVDDEFVRHQTLFSENGILEAKHMARIVSHVDPRYLFHVMDHIRSQREKLLNGDLPLRDMIKPYLYAVMSQGSGSQPVAGIEAHMGMKIPDIYVEDGQLRPEGATAFVLAETEVGKRLLDEVESGNISQETSEGFMSLMSIFGKGATYDLSDPAAKNTSTRYFHLFDTPPDGAVNLTNFALEMESLRNGDAFREGTHHEQLRRLKGIGPGKTGFMGHFFGIGDRGTIDIREVTLWLYGTDSDLKTKPELKKALELAKGNDLSPIQQEFLKRIEEVGKAVGFDEDVAAYMGHHLLWDFVKGEFTHHAGLYYAITGTAPLYQDAIQRTEENRTQQKSLLDKRYSPELDLFATTQLVELIRTAHGNGYSIDEQIQANKRLKTSFKAWQKSSIIPTLDTATVVDQSALKAVETRLYEMIEGIEPSEREAGYRADIAVQESVRHMEKRC